MSFHLYSHLADPDFLSKEAPPSYVAGLGRGAVGFTTRADIGPAREGLKKALGSKSNDPNGVESEDVNPNSESGLFSTLPYEADDEEADKVYAQVDAKMEERRKRQRETQEQLAIERFRQERPKVGEQFKDLKKDIEQVTAEEWAAIPEVGDLVQKNKRSRLARNTEHYYAAPDSLLNVGSGLPSIGEENPVAEDPQRYIFQSFAPSSSVLKPLASLSEAKEKMIGVKLDQVSDSVTGQTNVDPRGYLTSLSSQTIKSNTEISDLKRARTLLKSVVKTNPRHAPGWIAAARLEEVATNIKTARKLLQRGCEMCPLSEDVWLETARLQKPDDVAKTLASALSVLPNSVALWLKAIDVETTQADKRKIVRKAVEVNPSSIKLWKAAIELEDDRDVAASLLTEAVRNVPLAVEFWLALARLEPYETAKVVLNKARAAVPSSHQVWIAALKLEEKHSTSNGDPASQELLCTIMDNALKVLSGLSVNPNAEAWLKEAQTCEKEGYPQTSHTIIFSAIRAGKPTVEMLLQAAQESAKQGCVSTVRSVYALACDMFTGNELVWEEAAFFEKESGNSEQLDLVLQQAVRRCPQNQVLWLLGAKERYLRNDIAGAQLILEEAFKANPNSEQIWLAAYKLELESGQTERTRALLANARASADTPRIWLKSIHLERLLRNRQGAQRMLEEALKKFPLCHKLYLIGASLFWDDANDANDVTDLPRARSLLAKAMSRVKSEPSVYILASRLEFEGFKSAMKARLILEKARHTLPKCGSIWVASILLELRCKQHMSAKSLLVKALQHCPHDGNLWALAIKMEPTAKRKAKCADALNSCPDDARVVCAVAHSFYQDNKFEKARAWFQKATQLDQLNGDIWAARYLCEEDPSLKKLVADDCTDANPNGGIFWPTIAKSIRYVNDSISRKLELVSESLAELCKLFRTD